MDALKKFMDSMGIEYKVEKTNIYHQGERGTNVICVRVSVTRGEEQEYLQYHCYSKRKDGTLKYVEGNEVLGIHQGVLAYLGMDREIDNYFDNKAREVAKEYL
jgi:hypothetical protein